MKNAKIDYKIEKPEMRKIILYFLWGILILSPVIILAAESLFFGRNLFVMLPSWSDELEYWREVYSFSNCGVSFGGSYFWGYEAAIGPFGAHSVTPIAAWGLFFLFFRTGINIYLILWINLIYLVIAWGVFVWMAKPNLKQTICSLLLAYLFPYTILYLHTSMVEMTCLSGMILFFGLFYAWDYASNTKKSKIIFAVLIFVGIWCTLLRPTYAVILFPVIWAKNDFKINWKTVLFMMVYVLGFVLLYMAYSKTSAIYPNGIMFWLPKITDYHDKTSYILKNVRINMNRFFSPTMDDLCQFGMRMLYLGLLVYALVSGIIKEIRHRFDGRLEMSLFLIMAANMAATVFLYDVADWRDFRTFAPIAFGCLFILLLKEKNKWMFMGLETLYAMAVCLFLVTNVNNIETRNDPKYTDLSPYFANIEQVDENGNARTVVFDFSINWCDISMVSSVPAKMGYEIFWGEANQDMYAQADYIFVPEGYEVESGELEVSVPGYGCLYRMFE